MPRPKRDPNVIPAQKRIENAFWNMLDEMPYDDITISSLSRRAQVNHNTFYYYFNNLDDMAVQIMNQTLNPELPLRILEASRTGNFDIDVIFAGIVQKEDLVKLSPLFGNHAPSWMVQELKSLVYQLWLETLGIPDPDEELESTLKFILGGMLQILGDYGIKESLERFNRLFELAIGQGILASIQELSDTSSSRANNLQ